MSGGKALLAGIAFPALLLAVVAWAVLGGRGGEERTWRAEFQNVGVLVPGHEVRDRGAMVGSVTDVRLTDRGTAMVTFSLLDGVRAPRADATASVRTADLLGDVYLALEGGRARPPLRAAIPPERTFVATRLQDVLDTFDRPTRTALQGLLVELGRSLEARGVDLNGAVLQLAPALTQVERISRQLGAHDTQLDRLIASAHELTAQVAPRTRDLDRLIVGLERTLATTAVRGADLNRGLRDLPATLRRSRATLARLQGTARAATPLARDVGRAAPQLTRAARSLGPFARDAEPALRQLRPVVRLADVTLRDGRRSLPRLSRALDTTRAQAPRIAALARVLDPLVGYAVKGVFGGLGGLAAEPGDPASAGGPGRNFFRGEAVLGCETFGVPTRPGCLADVIAAQTRSSAGRKRASTRRRTSRRAAPRAQPAPRAQRAPSAPPAERAPDAPAPRTPANPLAPLLPRPQTPSSPTPGGDTVDGLLDYLLGP